MILASMASEAITTASQHQKIKQVDSGFSPKPLFFGQSLGDAQNGASYLAIRGALIDRVHWVNKLHATFARYHHRLTGEPPKWPSPAAKQTNDPETA